MKSPKLLFSRVRQVNTASSAIASNSYPVSVAYSLILTVIELPPMIVRVVSALSKSTSNPSTGGVTTGHTVMSQVLNGVLGSVISNMSIVDLQSAVVV